ncbi:MAG: hypothetical protein AAFY11_05650, partial [Cyanobacteria bacterium J06641_5]
MGVTLERRSPLDLLPSTNNESVAGSVVGAARRSPGRPTTITVAAVRNFDEYRFSAHNLCRNVASL